MTEVIVRPGRRMGESDSLSADRERAAVRRGLRPLLEPNERIDYAFRATAGPRGAVWLGPSANHGGAALVAPVLLAAARALKVMNVIVVVTDRAIVLVRASQFAERPVEVIARLPRQTQIGPFAGRGWITLHGTRMWVRDVPDLLDVQAADQEMGYDTGPPAIW
ncbi:MAG: hypothetical protein QOG43_2733 [Actinomycetota bacterium]|jgi:hypothetical protein|nr:hypothetical protein [Actinomycetota bacterium]